MAPESQTPSRVKGRVPFMTTIFQIKLNNVLYFKYLAFLPNFCAILGLRRIPWTPSNGPEITDRLIHSYEEARSG